MYSRMSATPHPDAAEVLLASQPGDVIGGLPLDKPRQLTDLADEGEDERLGVVEPLPIGHLTPDI